MLNALLMAASSLTVMAEETGIPYQTLINLFLRDCAALQRKLEMS